MFKKYVYILLFASVFVSVVFVFPAIASHSQVSSNDYATVPPWLMGTGTAVGGGGIGMMAKAKLDEFSSKVKEISEASSLSAPLSDYTNSPQYLKEKLKVLASEFQKTDKMIAKLDRRYNYIERQLIRRVDGYQGYEDYKNKTFQSQC